MKMNKLDEAAYRYIVIDDGWQAKTLAPDGSLVTDTTKFPNGIAFLTNYVKGLGF